MLAQNLLNIGVGIQTVKVKNGDLISEYSSVYRYRVGIEDISET